MLKERVISAIIGIPVVLGFLFIGRFAFAGLILILILLGLDEFFSLLEHRDYRPSFWIGMPAGILLWTGALFFGPEGLLLGVTFAAAVCLAGNIKRAAGFTDAALTLTGILYVGAFFCHLLLLYDLPHGVVGVLLVFLGTWASDIAAFAVGGTFGKRKIAPRVSPQKTVAGAAAGLVAPLLLMSLVSIWFSFGAVGQPMALLRGALFGLLIGAATEIGDLAQSRFKRELRVKDTGTLIPGHGGILDRFDGLLLSCVVGYYLWLVLI